MVPVIIIPVLNRYDLLDRCLRSIDYPVETLIIIDNGGQSSLHDWPWVIDRRMVKNYHVWSMPTNLGVAPSWNIGIKATPHADGWIILNSDAFFEPGQLEVFYNDCKPDSVTLTEAQPGWCCAWIGSEVVAKVPTPAASPCPMARLRSSRAPIKTKTNLTSSRSSRRSNWRTPASPSAISPNPNYATSPAPPASRPPTKKTAKASASSAK